MKLKFLIFNFSFLILTACGVTKPVATTHTERIETHLQPIPIGADTIEIKLNVGTRHAVSANPNGNSRDARLERPLTREGQNPTSTASSNLCKSDERLLTKSKQRIKKELKNQSDLCNLWETPHSEGVNSVRNKNSVRISSTRGVNISRHETDTTSTLRITLRPDTVFVPYINHIRSDTIVVPCPTTQAKLTTARWQIFALILILIAMLMLAVRRAKLV